ncbi:hypothetical protein G6F57_014183 [Rhizopus arrhizus]|nr:hypothetical protein G6F57_014183 [Rhizopus arrhizus]
MAASGCGAACSIQTASSRVRRPVLRSASHLHAQAHKHRIQIQRQLTVDPFTQRLARIGRRAGRLHAGPDVVGVGGDERLDDVGLAGVVMEQIAGAHRRPLTDLRSGGRVETVLRKTMRRGVKDMAAAFLLLDGICFAHG